MATKKLKPGFPDLRKVPDTEAEHFEDRQERRARGLPAPPTAPNVALTSPATATDATRRDDGSLRGPSTDEASRVTGSEPADSMKHEAASLQDYGLANRGTTSTSDAASDRDPGNAAPPRRGRGGWTKSSPYTRKDGVPTRSTTIYLPVDLADRLRRYAFEADRKQSDVVVEAIELLLSQKPFGKP